MLTTDTGGAYEVPQAGRGAQPAEAKSGARQEPVESPMTHVQPAPGHPPLFPHSPPLFGSNLMPRVSFSCIFTRGLFVVLSFSPCIQRPGHTILVLQGTILGSVLWLQRLDEPPLFFTSCHWIR